MFEPIYIIKTLNLPTKFNLKVQIQPLQKITTKQRMFKANNLPQSRDLKTRKLVALITLAMTTKKE